MTRFMEKEKVVGRVDPAFATRTTSSRPTAAVATLVEALRRRVRRRAVIAELARLDDRMLADIGVARHEIAELATRTVGGAVPGWGAIALRFLLDLVVDPARRAYARRIAYRDLMRMDERMLRDIGLTRAEIPALFRAGHPAADGVRPLNRGCADIGPVARDLAQRPAVAANANCQPEAA